MLDLYQFHPANPFGKAIHSHPSVHWHCDGQPAVVVLVVVAPPAVVVLVEAQAIGGVGSVSAQPVQVQSPMFAPISRQKVGYWHLHGIAAVVLDVLVVDVLVVVVVVASAANSLQHGSVGLQVVEDVDVVVVVVPGAVVLLVLVVRSAHVLLSASCSSRSQISPDQIHRHRPEHSFAVVVLVVVVGAIELGGVTNSNRSLSGIGPATQAIG